MAIRTEREGHQGKRHRGSKCLLVMSLALMTTLTGCASLDTAPDVDRATALVGERTGEAPQWDLPWDEPHAIWDGESPLAGDDAVRIALVNNREIRAALEEIAMARADLVQSGLLPNPVLNIALGFPIDGSGGATSVGIGLTQQLVALWLRGDRMTAAEFELDRAILNVSDDALELVKLVRQQHTEILYAEQRRSLLAEQQSLLEQLASLMQQRQDAGEASRLDVSRLTLQRQTLDAALLEQEQQVVQHKLSLLSLMGWSEASIEWTIENESNAQGWQYLGVPDERDLIAILDTQRLDLLAARATADAHAAALRIEDRQRLSRGVDAGIAFERDDDRRKELGPTVSLEIPIFDTNDAQVARALAAYRQAAIEADRVRQRAITEVRVLRSECARLAELITLHDDEILPAVEENLRLAQQSIEAGIVDATVLIESQRERIGARLQLSDLERRLTNRRHALERAVGGRLQHRPDEVADSPSL